MMDAKARILLIYTGGTIGMVEDPKTGALTAFDFEHLNRQIPELSRIDATLKVLSLGMPIDSSDMNPLIWQDIAYFIVENYAKFDGFVVLHGSDTMAYTASALSFMLQGLSKPVILTGSQLPIGTIRTDGKENLITSIEIAAEKSTEEKSLVQEVAIYFEYSLYRGNRTTKISSKAFEAFSSPNYTPLAVAGLSIDYSKNDLYRSVSKELIYRPNMCQDVALLKLFPGISSSIYKSLFDKSSIKAIIIESFGSGNFPNDSSLYQLMQEYITSGGIVVNITQCISGSVSQGKYANSTKLNEIGVIGGGDMTTEATVTKLMHLLGNYENREDVIRLFQEDLSGEITV